MYEAMINERLKQEECDAGKRSAVGASNMISCLSGICQKDFRPILYGSLRSYRKMVRRQKLLTDYQERIKKRTMMVHANICPESKRDRMILMRKTGNELYQFSLAAMNIETGVSSPPLELTDFKIITKNKQSKLQPGIFNLSTINVVRSNINKRHKHKGDEYET